jgi:hypothetical protein
MQNLQLFIQNRSLEDETVEMEDESLYNRCARANVSREAITNTYIGQQRVKMFRMRLSRETFLIKKMSKGLCKEIF